jgi:hypothetical protein
MRRNTRKLRSKKLKGGSLSSLASFDMSKMSDVIKAISAITDSLRNAPQLLQSFQDKIKVDIMNLIGTKTKEITATAVSAATAAATTAAAAASAGNLDAMQQKIKDAANLAAAEAAKLTGSTGEGDGEGEADGEGEGEGSNAEPTNEGSNAEPTNEGSNAEYTNEGSNTEPTEEGSNAEYTNEGGEFSGGRRKKRASRYPRKTRRNRKR